MFYSYLNVSLKQQFKIKNLALLNILTKRKEIILTTTNEFKIKVAHFHYYFSKTLSVVKPSLWWHFHRPTVLVNATLPISHSGRMSMR